MSSYFFCGIIFSCNRILVLWFHIVLPCLHVRFFFLPSLFPLAMSFFIAPSFTSIAYLSSSICSILCIMICNCNSTVDFRTSCIVFVNVLSTCVFSCFFWIHGLSYRRFLSYRCFLSQNQKNGVIKLCALLLSRCEIFWDWIIHK